jgi:hypothetical protein
MVIQSSNVNLSSTRDYSKKVRTKQSVTSWQKANPANCSSYTINTSIDYEETSLYNNYNDFAQNMKNAKSQKKETQQNENFALPVSRTESQTDTLQSYMERAQKIYRSLLELLFRGRTKLQEQQNNYLTSRKTLDLSGMWQNSSSLTESITVGDSSVWNRVTNTSYHSEERETTSFSGMGTAVTADGRTLDFNVSFTLSREFKEEYQLEKLEEYELVLTDPLVINLDSSPASLSDQTFLFDIDCDGKQEELSTLSGSSGFLALDKNGDGTINDGSELFGTKSGNGFADLAEYDQDGNGWIDEADDVYSKLRVWVKAEDGSDRLLSLKEADVGAIYLGNAYGSYMMKNEEGTTDGVVRSSGIFLHESGMAGVVQQIDLADHKAETT